MSWQFNPNEITNYGILGIGKPSENVTRSDIDSLKRKLDKLETALEDEHAANYTLTRRLEKTKGELEELIVQKATEAIQKAEDVEDIAAKKFEEVDDNIEKLWYAPGGPAASVSKDSYIKAQVEIN